MKRKGILMNACLTIASFAMAQTLVLAPGAGNATNVTARLEGPLSVQINDSIQGGGIVRLMNEWNQYTGDTTVLCGTLEPSVIRETHLPSALGRNVSAAQTVTVGAGTFRYAGPAAESARRLVVNHPWYRHAAVLDIASGLTFTGGAFSRRGSILKTGPGTLTLEQPDGVWQMTTRGDGFNEMSPTVLAPSGDASENIYETGSLTVLEGRLAIDGGPLATNYFGTACPDNLREACNGMTYIGKSSADGVERSAHIDLLGGYNHFGEIVRFDASNGYQTAVNSSLTVKGGKFLAKYVFIGDAKGQVAATCPEMTVCEDGTAKVAYLHLAASRGSKGRLSVAGGTVDATVGAIYVAHESGTSTFDDPLLPVAEISVSSNGYLVGNLSMGTGGHADLLIRLASGGVYQLWGGINTELGRVTIEGDGGSLRSTSAATFKKTALHLAAGGLTLSSDHALTFPGEVRNAASLGGARPGPLVLECASANFTGEMSFTGEIVARASSSLFLSGDVAASCVTMNNGTLRAQGTDVTIPSLRHGLGAVTTLAFDASSGRVAKLHLGAWDVPATVQVSLSGVVSGQTYDLLTCPADCGVSEGTFLTAQVNDALTATYSVVASADRATVRVTIGPAAAALADGGTRTWSAAAGGAWTAPENWAEGSAPADGARTAVAFPTASVAEKTAVTLEKGVALSGLAFDAGPGYRIAGSGALDVMKSGTAVVSAKTGTNAVETAMTYAGELRLAAQLGARLEIAKLDGRGNVQLNDGSSGAAAGLSGLGAVVIDQALVNGTLTERNGLLEVGRLGPGISALSIGYGLFRYTGEADFTLNGSLTAWANNYAQTQIEITRPEATLTVAGLVTQVEGGFTKRGKGTLVFDGVGENTLSHASLHNYGFSDAGYAGHDNAWGVNGLSPLEGSGQARSFFGLSVAGGLLRWGKEGQSLTIRGRDFVVGTTTTATPGAEFDAAAEINGGTTVVADGNIVVSYNHGNSKKATAEKETLVSKLTVNDGVVTASKNLLIANNDWGVSQTDSQYVQNGGSVSVGTVCVGHRDIGKSKATLLMTGGTLTASGWMKVAPEQGAGVGSIAQATVDVRGGNVNIGGYFSLGYNSWGNPTTFVTLENATVVCKEYLRAYCGSATVALNEGAVLQTQGIDVMGTYAGNPHSLTFNGGRFRCSKTSLFDFKDWKTFNILEKGAWFDTSAMTGGMIAFRNPVTTAEGALHICGSNFMRPVAFDTVPFAHTFVVEAGGSAYSYLAACEGATALVKGGGALGSRWTSAAGAVTDVTTLSLGETGNDRTTLYYTTQSGYLTPFKVQNLSLQGRVEVAIVNNAMNGYEAAHFTAKPILIAPKGTIDETKFGITGAQSTLQATFAVTSYDETCDQLVLTTVAATGDTRSTHQWVKGTGGAWGEAANWDVLPANRENEKIVLPASVTGPQTITLGGQRIFGSLSSAADDVTLAGGTLAMASSGGYANRIETTRGTLTLPDVMGDETGVTLATRAGSTQVVARVATETAAGTVQLNPEAGAGTIRLTTPQNAQSLAVSSGTLEGPASVFNRGQVTVKNATLRLTESGFVKSRVVGADEGFVLRAEEDVWFEGDVSAPRTFIKAGPGTAYLGGAGPVTLGSRNWDQANDNPTPMTVNGDMPGTKDDETLFVNAGTLALGLNPSQNVQVPNGHLFIGSRYVEFDPSGALLQPTLEIWGGTMKLPNLRMGAGVGAYRQIPGNEGKILRPTLSIYGGDITFAGFYLGSNEADVNSINTVNLYGGTFRSADQWITFGYGRTTVLPEYGQTKSIVNIHSGLLELTNPASNVGEISKANGDVEINLYGGELSYAGRCHVTAVEKATKIDIRLAGGRLTATELTCANLSPYGTGDGYRKLFWDGGTFRPRASGALAANWTDNLIGEGGARFDLSLIGATGGVYTLNKPFVR